MRILRVVKVSVHLQVVVKEVSALIRAEMPNSRGVL